MDDRKDRRLIEEWLPIAPLGIESVRERTPMTPFPAPNRLHVWWARRPLVASRAAVLASLLPADADRPRFLHILGIHGDPVASRLRIDAAKRTGKHLGPNPFGYKRAFSYSPDAADRAWLSDNLIGDEVVLDPTAGGGSIPFETARLGISTMGNDLNPVATLLQHATIEWPLQFGHALVPMVQELGKRLEAGVREHVGSAFPHEPLDDADPIGYLWARTVSCPYCLGVVPLSPNWRLDPSGTGVRLVPEGADPDGDFPRPRTCSFEIVTKARDHSPGTVARGTATCPFPDCRQVIDNNEITEQARSGDMGEQLYAVVYKRRQPTYLKSGKRGKDKWVREYRAPRPQDDNADQVAALLRDRELAWDRHDIIPTEPIPEGYSAQTPHRYGMPRWRDMFSPRQLLCHATSVDIYRQMLEADEASGALTPVRKAAYGYLALALDTLLNYNSRSGRWDLSTGRVRSIFDRHDFGFVWSYAEMPLIVGGYDWAIEKTVKCIGELADLLSADGGERGGPGGLFRDPGSGSPSPGSPSVAITCTSADSLDHLGDGSVDAVVMDPPYYDNVMYAELSDFFYVWLKRTAGRVFPELFERFLTDKDSEAVANPVRFRGLKGAKARAGQDYQERMQEIFAECRRVLKPDGVMTLMFTHKAAGAWDALTTGLIEAGFTITASWPINTEAPGSMHIKDKAAANSTVFLVCRPRASGAVDEHGEEEGRYWEDIELEVVRAVRERISDFQKAGIEGVDLYLASFGPALERFASNWPLSRGRPRPKPDRAGQRLKLGVGEEWDPYAVTPEDALDVARREVKRWRLNELTPRRPDADLDRATSFFVLAWDAFRAPRFPYDEALKLARAIGCDLDRDVVGRMAEKRGANLTLWDSLGRAAKGSLGPGDGSRGMIDVLHHIAHAGRAKSLQDAVELLERTGLAGERRFAATLEAVLEVLPVSARFTGFELPEGSMRQASHDFDVLENIRRLKFQDKVREPKQMQIWQD